MVKKEFVTNKELIKIDFLIEKNYENKVCYFSNYNQTKREQIHEEDYKTIKHYNTHLKFFTWFSCMCKKELSLS